MLELGKLEPKNIDDYKPFVNDGFLDSLKKASEPLQNKKIFHISASPLFGGGGITEVLKSVIPLERALGIDSQWYSIKPTDSVFSIITKRILNALQGANITLSTAEIKRYLDINKLIAKSLEELTPDLLILHDPQPLAAIGFYHNVPMISRLHFDFSEPNNQAVGLIMPYLSEYDKIVFTTKEFILNNLPKDKIEVHPVAIDPLAEKNKPINPEYAKSILQILGIDTSRPIIAQVSRFDPWKDPVGVIQAYYMAKNTLPGLQLILLGNILTEDNPEAKEVFRIVKKYASGDPDIFLFKKPPSKKTSNEMMVKTVQSASDIILQKSIKEGFGLSIAEAMWQGRPVIGGNVGGIKLQIENGVNGFLVSTPKEASERIIELIKNPELAKKMGTKAKESVRKNFLMPRLLSDHIKLYSSILNL
ncbi:MAG: glycosyl transferase family 1 [Candidatus Yanofskybacteria bacterium CG10_big_fil_rev_8_21_14_0_10_36_16]|uniref:Glycosyl transferase family 1 n=1 Tax=Candidatus Yanofskybacteria bacterium CG10_big_fil_rev_8_21_14_0_10_36_16 TaxID=1975096 RepID=A0A2J0Q8B7_9BACT|nr:MAG: glycosyl transferase family 1 [Candidatus Yanofskybacteria bacterium CG10_big_fil_rev_8_21_14_0_10_36_16]